MKKREIYILIILALVQFIHIVDFMLIMPLEPRLTAAFHLDAKEFSYIAAIYTFAAAAVGFFGSFVLDRFDRKKVLQVSFIGFLAGTLACYFVNSYGALLGARFVAGAFGGISSAMVFSIATEIVAPNHRGYAMGIVSGGFSAASVLGVPIGLIFSQSFNWQFPFLVLAILGVGVWFLFSSVVPEVTFHLKQGHPRVSPIQTLKNLVKDSNQVYALAFMSSIMLAQFCIVPFISPYLVHNVGYPEDYLWLMYSIGGFFTIFTSPLFGKLSDRAGKPVVFSVLALLSFIPIFLITNLPPVSMPVVLILTTGFFIIVGGRGAPAMAMITSAAPARSRGSFMGINTAVQHFSTSIAIVVGGVIMKKDPSGAYHNYNIVGYVCLSILLLCIFLSWKVKPAVDPNAVKH